jgi:hypothetical protein
MLLLPVATDVSERQHDHREARRVGFFRRWGGRGFHLGHFANFKQIYSDRLSDVLGLGRAEIMDRQIEPSLDLPIGLLGETNRAGLGYAFQPSGDVHSVAHQVAVGLLDDIAQMNADPELDALVRRNTRVAFDHSDLDFDRAAHCVDDAAELGDEPVARALDDTPAMRSDGGIDEIATEAPQAR